MGNELARCGPNRPEVALTVPALLYKASGPAPARPGSSGPDLVQVPTALEDPSACPHVNPYVFPQARGIILKSRIGTRIGSSADPESRFGQKKESPIATSSKTNVLLSTKQSEPFPQSAEADADDASDFEPDAPLELRNELAQGSTTAARGIVSPRCVAQQSGSLVDKAYAQPERDN